ncbi:MAG TPA: hypothetical protein VML55_09705 [Planctomycetaceae bacterium]|nr:hypothetical protein [Planctomycetaceae bacterium]
MPATVDVRLGKIDTGRSGLISPGDPAGSGYRLVFHIAPGIPGYRWVQCFNRELSRMSASQDVTGAVLLGGLPHHHGYYGYSIERGWRARMARFCEKMTPLRFRAHTRIEVCCPGNAESALAARRYIQMLIRSVNAAYARAIDQRHVAVAERHAAEARLQQVVGLLENSGDLEGSLVNIDDDLPRQDGLARTTGAPAHNGRRAVLSSAG